MTDLHGHPSRAHRGFERLYRRHAADVYRYALAVLRNPDDAEDVTQTTFLNAYRAFERGDRPDAPKTWLIAIAHNVCRQRFRQSSRRPNEVLFDEGLAAAVPSDDGPSAGDIRHALGHLAFNQRAALVMRELEGRSYTEIAGILEISVSAVETLIFRARRALREQLEEALTCDEAEFAISRQLDGRLQRAEKGRLRGHLRACDDCAALARSQRAQRSALRGLGAIPLPSSLVSFFGSGGGASVGTAVGAKAVVTGATALLAAGVGYTGVQHHVFQKLVPGGHAAQAVSAAPREPVVMAPGIVVAARVTEPQKAARSVRRTPGSVPAASGKAAVAQPVAASPATPGARPALVPAAEKVRLAGLRAARAKAARLAALQAERLRKAKAAAPRAAEPAKPPAAVPPVHAPVHSREGNVDDQVPTVAPPPAVPAPTGDRNERHRSRARGHKPRDRHGHHGRRATAPPGRATAPPRRNAYRHDEHHGRPHSHRRRKGHE